MFIFVRYRFRFAPGSPDVRFLSSESSDAQMMTLSQRSTEDQYRLLTPIQQGEGQEEMSQELSQVRFFTCSLNIHVHNESYQISYFFQLSTFTESFKLPKAQLGEIVLFIPVVYG